MSWQDRPYAHSDRTPPPPGRPTIFRGSGAEPMSVATTLIIVNVVIHLLQTFAPPLWGQIANFGAMRADLVVHGQIWRLFTATYLHLNFSHIFLNMLALYFLGPPLERVWGPRQFMLVYTIGGIAGNIVLTVAGMVGFMHPETWGLGASGSVLTLLGAAAVLFPHAEVYVYFLLPVRIQTFALVYGIWFYFNILNRGSNYGGDIAHLTGLLVGAAWAYSGGVSLTGRHRTVVNPSSLMFRMRRWLTGGKQTPQASDPYHEMWEQRRRQREQDEATIDRLLEKVARDGVRSLSPEEHIELTQATARKRAYDAQRGRL